MLKSRAIALLTAYGVNHLARAHVVPSEGYTIDPVELAALTNDPFAYCSGLESFPSEGE